MEWATLLERSDDVATTRDLIDSGCREASIRRRVAAGHWQRVLPGVVVAHSGPPTRLQIRRASLLWAGAGAMLSHCSAADMLGLRITETVAEITVPHGVRRRSNPLVQTHQSNRRTSIVYRSGLPCTPVARTVIDVACTLRRRNDVRALVSDSVQRGLTTFAALAREAELAPRHNPMLLRSALEEVAAGARSAGEAEFRRLVRLAGLPEPELNAKVVAGQRSYTVDALWRDCRVIVEIDGMANHSRIDQWEADLRRQNALHAAGYLVIRFPVRRLFSDPEGVIAELRTVLLRMAS